MEAMSLQERSKGVETPHCLTDHFGPVNGGSQELEKHGIERGWGSEGLDILAQALGSQMILVA